MINISEEEPVLNHEAFTPLYTMARPSWIEYFMDLAKLASTRATCPVRQVGSVFVDPATKIVLATGYNASPRNTDPCGRACYEREHGQKTTECRAVHSEVNGIYGAALQGIKLNGSHLFCTLSPCINCARALIQVGVKCVYYGEDSAYLEALDELRDADILVQRT